METRTEESGNRRDLRDKTAHGARADRTCLGSDATLLARVLEFLEACLDGKNYSTIERVGTLRAIGPDAVGVAERTLINYLRTPNYEVSRRAMSVLRDIVSPATPMLGAVQEGLWHPLGEICNDAIWAIRKIGSAAARFVPELVYLLEHDSIWNDWRCSNVIHALEEIGPSAVAAVPALLKLSRSDWESEIRSAIGSIGPVAISGQVSAIREGKKSTDLVTISRVIRKAAVPALENALLDPNARVREAAVDALVAIGGDGYGQGVEHAIPRLSEVLANKEEEPTVREKAAWALLAIAANGEDRIVVAAFEAALADQSVVVRRYAVQGLVDALPKSQSAIPALLRCFDDEDLEVRRRVALGSYRLVTSEPDLTVPILFRRIASVGCFEAAWALMQLDRAVLLPRLPDLVELLCGPDSCGRREAAEVLGQLGELGIAALRDGLRHPVVEVRQAAASALRQLRDSDEDVVTNALVELEGEEDDGVRRTIAEAFDNADRLVRLIHAMQTRRTGQAFIASLLKILRDQKSRSWHGTLVQLALCDALTDPRPEVRRCAAELLVDVIDLRGEVPKALRNALHDADKEVRRLAITILVKFGPVVVPDLAGSLQDDEPDLRRAAADSLGQIGPRASQAGTALARALGDRDGDVRKSAAAALGRIGPLVSELGQRMKGELVQRHKQLHVFRMIGEVMLEQRSEFIPFVALEKILKERFGEEYSARTLSSYRDDMSALFRKYRGEPDIEYDFPEQRTTTVNEAEDYFDHRQGRPFRILDKGWESWGEIKLYFALLEDGLQALLKPRLHAGSPNVA